MIISKIVEKMTNLGLFESQYDLSQYWFEKGPSYVSSMKCRNRQPSTEALLMFSSRLESTARQFSQSEYPSIRDKSQGMKLLAEEVRQEIDKRISI
jgi:hypothetical protein